MRDDPWNGMLAVDAAVWKYMSSGETYLTLPITKPGVCGAPDHRPLGSLRLCLKLWVRRPISAAQAGLGEHPVLPSSAATGSNATEAPVSQRTFRLDVRTGRIASASSAANSLPAGECRVAPVKGPPAFGSAGRHTRTPVVVHRRGCQTHARCLSRETRERVRSAYFYVLTHGPERFHT
jgi:hypothetical protein